jgi:tRNA nucleotidyltransferase (CCA-adding enzyme)
MTTARPNAEALFDRLEPAQRRVLAAVRELAARPPRRVYLVGGPVRDLLRGEPAHDLDFVVEGDGPAFAARLARRLHGSIRVFPRFGTAVVGGRAFGHVDVTSTRSEQYPEPGALPEVALGKALEEDLRRRDFTLNAMALGVGPEDWGQLYDPLDGQKDLHAARLRIVHERSFLDDPNRLIRAAAFAARLEATLEPHTERRLREAAATGALATISPARRNDTLRRLLQKPRAAQALTLLSDWGLLAQLGLGPELAPADRERLERVPEALAALGEPPDGTGAAHAYRDLLLARPGVDVEAGALELGLGRKPRAETLRAVEALRQPPALLREAHPEPAALYAALRDLDRGALAALGTGATPAGRRNLVEYWRTLRPRRPDVSGADLAQAGLRGAAIAAGLRRALELKLNRPEATAEEQLQAALRPRKTP